MKLSDWAGERGVSHQTAWRWHKAGKLPVRYEQMPSWTIIVHPEAPAARTRVTIYARVSRADRKEDLVRQASRLDEYASANGWPVVSVVEEVGSGLNGRRKKLLGLLSAASVGMILVEHRDRLARFGVEYMEAALASRGRSIIVADETEEMADIWADFIDVVTYKCAWYGMELVVVPRFEATSKPCSVCGWLKEDLTLSDRTFRCDACVHAADRDENEADNMLALAVSSTERINGRRGDVRPLDSERRTPEKRQLKPVG